MLKHFAFVSGEDVFSTASFDEDNLALGKWIALFSSNPEVINVNDYPDVNKTYFYKDGNFYAPDDIEFTTPVTKGESLPIGFARYAIVADNDVVGILTYIKEDMDPDEFERSIAGLDSSPSIIPCESGVAVGWTWDGESFTAPVG